jgi:hypothetical protein
MTRCLPLSAALLAGALLLPPGARAQIRASEAASVSQTIDGTHLTVTYSRPRARGRSPLFGRVVRWDEVWTPGANWATTLEVDRDVRLEGHPLPKGKYSVWMVVREGGEWTAVLDPDARRFHMYPPDSSAKQLRFPVRAGEGPATDVLTWSFPEIRADGGTLALQWGTTRVAIDVAVEPSLRVTLPEAEAAPYLGRYSFAEKGSTKPREFVVSYEDGTLTGEWDRRDVGDGLQGNTVDYMGRFALIRIGPDRFVPGLYDGKGEIYEVLRPEMVFEFTRSGGRAESFDVRDDRDEAWASAKRVR